MKTLSIILLSFFLFHSTYSQKGNFHLDEVYKMNAAGKIDLRSSDGKVKIIGSSRNDVHVKIDRTVTTKGITFGEEAFAVEVDVVSGNLIIRERSKGSNVGIIGYYNEKYTIVIEAPQGVTLLVRGDDGDYDIKNIGGAITMDVDDADISLTGCTGDKFAFTLDDGDLKMDQGKGSLFIDIDDGDIEIKNAQFTKIDARLDDGDFIVNTSLADNGEYSIQSEDGMVVLNITGGGGEFDIHHDDSRIITQGDFKRLEKSESRTVVSLPKGTAKVNVRSDDGSIKLSTVN